MFWSDDVGFVEVGDGLGEFDGFKITTSRELKLIYGGLEKLLGGVWKLKEVADFWRRQRAIVFSGLMVAFGLVSMGDIDLGLGIKMFCVCFVIFDNGR